MTPRRTVEPRRTSRPARPGLRALLLVSAASLAPAVHAVDPRIAVGRDVVAVVRTDGTLWVWGEGRDGQLGDGRLQSSSVPLRVPGLDGVVDVAAAEGVLLALKADGTVWAWGQGEGGIFGSTQPAVRRQVNQPVPIPELSSIRALTVGRGNVAAWALDTAGRAYHWGSNAAGQAGTGAVGDVVEVKPVPEPMQALAGAVALAAGDDTFLAASSNGQVQVWGTNPVGALGVPFLTRPGGPPLAAAPLVGVGEVSAVAAMDLADGVHLAVRRDGSVAAWGHNSGGHAGCGQPDTELQVTITQPRVLGGLPAVPPLRSVVAGRAHALVLDVAGSVWGCGSNDGGQLGIGQTDGGTVAGRPGPLRASWSRAARELAAHGDTSAAVSVDGGVWVWGTLDGGAAGDGGPTTGPAARQVVTAPRAVVGGAGTGRFLVGDAARAAPLFAGTVLGPLVQATVHVGLAPALADVGREARLYVAALLPDGSLYALTSDRGWQPYTSGTVPSWRTKVLARHEPVTLFRDADLRFAAGAVLLTGYGIGTSDARASEDLLDRRLYGTALVLPALGGP